MKHSLKVFAIGAIAFALCFMRSLSAQVETGQLSGTVMDSSGALVSGASVKVRNIGTNAERTDSTSSSGTYKVTGLEPATYEVTVQATGFRPNTAKVQITVGGHVTFDANLSVTGTTAQVEVIGEGGTQVNTQTQELSQVVNEQQIADLPSLTRNPYDFVATFRQETPQQVVTRDQTTLIKTVHPRRAVWASVSTAREPAARKCCSTAWKTFLSSLTESAFMSQWMRCTNFV